MRSVTRKANEKNSHRRASVGAREDTGGAPHVEAFLRVLASSWQLGITKPSGRDRPSRARSASACLSARKEDDESVPAPHARFPSEELPARQLFMPPLIEVRLERESG